MPETHCRRLDACCAAVVACGYSAVCEGVRELGPGTVARAEFVKLDPHKNSWLAWSRSLHLFVGIKNAPEGAAVCMRGSYEGVSYARNAFYSRFTMYAMRSRGKSRERNRTAGREGGTTDLALGIHISPSSCMLERLCGRPRLRPRSSRTLRSRSCRNISMVMSS